MAFCLEAFGSLGSGWRPRIQEGDLRGDRIHDCASGSQ